MEVDSKLQTHDTVLSLHQLTHIFFNTLSDINLNFSISIVLTFSGEMQLNGYQPQMGTSDRSSSVSTKNNLVTLRNIFNFLPEHM